MTTSISPEIYTNTDGLGPADKVDMSWEEMEAMGIDLADQIAADAIKSGKKYTRLLLLPCGSLPPGLVVARRLRIRPRGIISMGIGTYETGGTQKTGRVEFGQALQQRDVQGERVVIVDDVCHTGDALTRVKEIVHGLGAEVVKTAVLDWKSEQACMEPDFYVRKTEAWINYPGETIPPHPQADLVFES